MTDEQALQKIEDGLKKAFNNAVRGIGYIKPGFGVNASNSEEFTKVAFDLADKLLSIKSDHAEEILREVNESFTNALDRIVKEIEPSAGPDASKRFARIAIEIADRIIPKESAPPLEISGEFRDAIKTVKNGAPKA